jgi:hypothetical protein
MSDIGEFDQSLAKTIDAERRRLLGLIGIGSVAVSGCIGEEPTSDPTRTSQSDTTESSSPSTDQEPSSAVPLGNYDSIEPKGGTAIGPRQDYDDLTERFVAPDGRADGEGSREDPWTAASISDNGDPGTVVTFLDGVYTDEIKPTGGGDDPVVLRAENRHRAELRAALRIEDTANVVVQGFHMRPTSEEGGRIVDIVNSNAVTIRDNFIVAPPEAARSTRLNLIGGTSVNILNNVVRGSHHNLFNGFPYPFSERESGEPMTEVLVAGNAFSRAGHAPANLFWNFERTVYRGNVFHPVTSRPFGLNGGRRALFEHNLVINAFDGPRSADSKGKFTVEDGIFRFNRIIQNRGTPIGSNPYASFNKPLFPLRIYNNIYANNDGRGHDISDGGEPADAIIQNNVFDGRTSSKPQLKLGSSSTNTRFILRENVFRGDHHVDIGGPKTIGEAEEETQYTITNNKLSSKLFRGITPVDVAPASSGDLIDAGEALTRTTESGEGTMVPVRDARPFSDGYGIDGLSGDPVRIGDEVTKIVAVDREGSTITVNESLSWNTEAPVSLPWTGQNPDAGLYDAGEGFAQIEIQGPHQVNVDEQVEFSAIIHGNIDVDSIAWAFGDGGGATGEPVSHTFNSANDYGIRVRVIDSSGAVHWGTHYLFARNGDTDPSTVAYNVAQVNRFICPMEDKNHPGYDECPMRIEDL